MSDGSKRSWQRRALRVVFWVWLASAIGSIGIAITDWILAPEKGKSKNINSTSENQKIQDILTQLAKTRPPELFPELSQKDVFGACYFRFADFCIVGNHVWAVGYRSGYHGYGYLIHSQDKGVNWEVQWSDPKIDPVKISFLNEQIGFLATEGALLSTEDSGRTWQSLLTIRRLPRVGINRIKSIRVLSRDQVEVYLRGDLNERLETKDNGKTWEYNVFNGRYRGSTLSPLAKGEGSKKSLFVSQDGGAGWYNAEREKY